MNKVRILLTIFMVALGSSLYSQGETCATAVAINNIPYNTPLLRTESTCGAGNNYQPGDRCGNLYTNNEEFVYSYTPTTTGCITFTATPAALNDAPMALFVTKDCPDDPDGECIAQFTNPDNAANTPKPATLDAYLEAGNTYFIQVTAMSECFDFTFSATQGNCQDYDEGGDCDNAEEINNLPYADSTGNCGHRGIVREGNYCYSTIYNDYPTYLYKYTPVKETCFKITGRTTDATMRMTVHDDCPTYSNNNCISTQYYYTYSQQTDFYTLDSGITYYFAFSSYTACTGINVTFSEVTDLGATCQTAVPISPINGVYGFDDGTTRCKGDEYKSQIEYGCSSFYDAGNDFVFECIGASYSTTSRFDGYGGIYMFKDCPDPGNNIELASSEKCNSGQGTTIGFNYTITDPGTYYFVVSGRYRKTSFSETYYDFDFTFDFFTATLDQKGVDCQNAHVLASSTNISEQGLNVFCKGDDYDPSDGCGMEHLEGSDYVLTYVAPIDFCGTVLHSW